MKELDVIDRLRAAFPDSGIGDDAAVIPSPRGEALFAADAAVEGVHFDRRLCTLSQAVQKLVTSNVSDIFAMGGSPLSIVFTAALQAGCSSADVDSIVDGLQKACTQYGIRLVGGDTVSSPHGFFFNVAIVGEAPRGRAVMRSGARPGDALVLFGEIGLSRAGLDILSSIDPARAFPAISIASSPAEMERIAAALGRVSRSPDAARCIRRHLVPLAVPLDAALLDSDPPRITAMIDVSDGLAKDLSTLCAESGVGALVREEALPIPGAIGELCGLEGEALIDFALSSGEEYVPLAAVTPEAARMLGAVGSADRGGGAAVIGTIVPAAEGITLVGRDGKRRTMPALGYEHMF